MLHIDRVVIHNFKSFKHANIRFGKAFNCIAGPNGSGKSNICDSLLFALGEQSLKRMRVSSAAQLINERKGRGSDDPHTYVKVVFDGDRAIEVLREIRGDRIVYRLDGKAVARQDIIDVLRENRCEINETNTITQGETARMIGLNPRERRELIDVAAGIKEFDIKKENALRELDKVEARTSNVQVLLNERLGFLSELEKEKEQAERYLLLTNRIKSINCTLLSIREKSLAEEYGQRVNALKKLASEKEGIEKRVTEIDSGVMKLSSEKEKLVKKLNDKSIDANSNNKLIEQLNKEIAINESKIGALKYNKDSLDERGKRVASESERIKQKLGENREKLSGLRKELSARDKAMPETEELGRIGASEKVSSDYKALQERVELQRVKLESLDKDHAQMLFDFSSMEKEAADLREGLAAKERLISERGGISASLEAELGASNGLKTSIVASIKKLEGVRSSLDEKLAELQSESINLREQIAMHGSGSDKVGALLRSAIKSGLYGKAEELCTYDDKYALAVSAAAASRLNYFVVESIEVADEAIGLIKGKGIGRATFIPLREVRANPTESKGGLKRLVDLVKFDKKFEKAFAYIFSNTYVVDDIKDAKKHGIGSCRYVTVDGELVEPSGTVTGGTIKHAGTLANLEARLKKTAVGISEVNAMLSSNGGAMAEERKKLALCESELARISVERKYASEELGRAAGEAERMQKTLLEKNEKRKRLGELLKKVSAEKDSLSGSLQINREASLRLYSYLTTLIIENGNKLSKAEAERYKKEREELEGLKVGIAELVKESSIMEERLKELASDSNEIAGSIGKLSADEKKASSEVGRLTGEMEELQEKVKSYDASTQSLYRSITELDAKINGMSGEKGRLSGSLERSNRDILEMETAKAQIEVRIGDVEAELSSYPGIDVIEGAKAEALEGELINKRTELEAIGAVNLRAPELYDKKKRDLEEVQEQMAVLGSEKASVLQMIDEIESKKLNIFSETLAKVDANFKKLFNHIFEGEAALKLDSPKEPFNSGLNISMVIDKRQKHIDRMSGGEKLLVMLMLIFSIQTMKPMSFYLFDEIDAALDKENSKKLSLLIKELAKSSQFIVVTHNDSMITASETNIGVAMHSHESRAVGVMLMNKG